MKPTKFFMYSSAVSLTAALLCAAAPVFAEDPTSGQVTDTAPAPSPAKAPPGAKRVPEVSGDVVVVVTGSRLRGTPVDSALPVDVMTNNDLRLSGSNDVHDVIKALPYNTGYSVGTNNPTQTPRSEGVSNVMLRGLGGTDILTLVLLNGERVPQIERGIRPQIDVSGLPMAAVGRIETLKDGGAVTYGSDAVAGVMNFITYKKFNGLDVGVDTSYIKNDDGDLHAHLTWGHTDGDNNLLLSAAYEHTGALAASSRAFTNQAFAVNPNAWSTSNPATYTLNNGVGRNPGTTFVDSGCAGLGGINVTVTGRTTAPACELQTTQFQNLVDETNRYKLYGEWNHRFGSVDFHVDGYFDQTDVPHVAGVPSSLAVGTAPSTGDTGTGAGVARGAYFIPASNPGLQALLGAGCSNAGALGLTAAQCGFAAANGVDAPIQSNYRVYGIGGNLADGGGADLNSRHYTESRVSATLKGQFGIGSGIDWSSNLTYGWTRSESTADGNLVQRLQLALRGLGGPTCNASNTANAGNTAAGCFYWNPFANAMATNAVTGAANPGYVASVANNVALAKWMMVPNETRGTDTIFTWDFNLTGKGFHLPGGDMGWATGVEFRRQTSGYTLDALGDLTLNPCADPGVTSCYPAVTGALADQSAGYPLHWSADTKAVYAELSLPITSTLNGQFAARYEDGPAGGTTNPKFALKWQPWTWLAFRGSFESTFRAPASWQTDPNQVLPSILFGVGNQGSNLQYNVYGNPNLKPETARNYDFGIIFTPTRTLDVRIDAWKYDFHNQLSQMNGNTIVSTMFPRLPSGLTSDANCNSAAYSSLQSQFVFNSNGCGYANIQSVKGMVINQTPIETNGYDIVINFNHDFGAAAFRSSLNATYLAHFKNSAVYTDGVQTLGAYDAAGYFNFNAGGAMPKWKFNWSNNLNFGANNLRLDTRYSSSIIDQRCNSTITGLVNPAGQDICAANYVAMGLTSNTGYKIKSSIIADLTYNYRIDDNRDVTLSIANLFDRAPPFARTDLSYDPYVDNGLGRVIRLSFHAKY